MDYEKMYYRLCNYCHSTPIENRMRDRDPEDKRLNEEYVYTEDHHIIPRHAGGTDNKENLVRMLPEEHYVAHLIRYVAFKDRNDFLAIRFMINGYVTKSIASKSIGKKTLNKLVSSFKSKISSFRKENSWHTEEGCKRISRSKRGKIVVRDSVTGEMIGSVETNHPKVISGEWVHHTKGRVSVFCKLTGEKKRIDVLEHKNNPDKYISNIGNPSGEKNPTFSGYSDNELVDIVCEFSKKIDLGIIIPYYRLVKILKNIKGYEKLPKSLSKFRFGGLGSKELNRIASERTGLPLSSYYNNDPIIREKIKTKIKKIIC